jgi:hypothetical protein
LSIAEAFTSFFHNNAVGLLLGLFFGWTLVNIYLLLLYTLARNMLVPPKVKATSRLALLLRVGTITFFAIIVSKPIEHFFFQKYTYTEIAIKKSDALEDMSFSVSNSYNERIRQLSSSVQKTILSNERDAELLKVRTIVSNTNYYLESLKCLSAKGWPWLVTLAIILLFVWPIYLKRVIDPLANYYTIKRQHEQSIVNLEYKNFKVEYKKIINSFVPDQDELEFSEPYTDPPYNFTLKTKNFKFSNQSNFLEEIHGG